MHQLAQLCAGNSPTAAACHSQSADWSLAIVRSGTSEQGARGSEHNSRDRATNHAPRVIRAEEGRMIARTVCRGFGVD
jgi:hypothetical protein